MLQLNNQRRSAEVEEKKESPKKSKSPSPFRSSGGQTKAPEKEDEINEDIEQDYQQDEEQAKRDAALLNSSGALSASAVGVDHSIDTMNLAEFDYIEEVKVRTPRADKEERDLAALTRKVDQWFEKCDKDKNGKLSIDEAS